jgi:GTP pyrophosphokinase
VEINTSEIIAGLTGDDHSSTELVARALAMASGAHAGQSRKNGDPYVTHPIQVAQIVRSWGMDIDSVCAALLHDVVEDTEVTLFEVEEQFGAVIAKLVDGLTKLDGVKLVGEESHVDAKAAANLQKLLLAISEDPRVLVVKLADRLHNIRTLDALSQHKATRIAKETMDVHAPLAQRLGMTQVANELEDLCFQALYPLRYKELKHQVGEKLRTGAFEIDQVCSSIAESLLAHGFRARVHGRTKHLWSVYEKMVTKNRALDDIYDLAGVRVVLDDTSDCYSALGVIHALYPPVPGRFKDWVASPKFNMYQSIHTTVVADGRVLEVQIRTNDMHQRAEWGVAAHWRYKSAEGSSETGLLARLHSVDEPGPLQYLEHIKSELGGSQVYCFTPRGDVLALEYGSTCVDFAYAVHTGVGDRCTGARVNGRLSSLDTVLSHGDRVEIITAKDAKPALEWLSFVVSAKARSRIRRETLAHKDRNTAAEGRDFLFEALAKMGVPQRVIRPDGLERVSRVLGFDGRESLMRGLGDKTVEASVVANLLVGVREPLTPVARDELQIEYEQYLSVDNEPGARIVLGRCCNVVHGDAVVGFRASQGNVIAHRSGCAGAGSDARKYSNVELSWTGEVKTVRVEISVEAIDRAGLLADVARVITENQIRIVASSTDTGSDMVAREKFQLQLSDLAQLATLLTALHEVDGVFSVKRQ